MKRDLDLVREILLRVESSEGDPRKLIGVESTGHNDDEISYHVMLLHQSGLLEATDLSHSRAFCWKPRRLTWAGHEFLDAAKNDTVWNRTKELVKEKGGSVSFEVLKAVVVKVSASIFGLG